MTNIKPERDEVLTGNDKAITSLLVDQIKNDLPSTKRAQFLKDHKELCERLTKVTEAKNSDYSGGADDPFFNFTKVEVMNIASTEQGFMTRIMDKASRVITFINKGVFQVKDESIEDTLLDLANYCLIFLLYIRNKKEQK